MAAVGTKGHRRVVSAKDLGAAVRDARRSQKIGQEELAELTGVSQPNISRIERGERPATVETYIRLLEAVGVDLVAVPRS
ncbi:helix-turn-helix domain-containing protein [Rhodobaculum claviforme]|uniref:HTH cro/C1-type domain-containing protein n=1 Tax=Rhodobaculum claviforme TaxID=1549854 RepID=A0A934TNC9_9RHOB|nr:helix-turn-helix transcriptional regulator [Rhodobaculum claviforme]MBK5928452.1 hypothetical protein [Rhodobaculum claviforme]